MPKRYPKECRDDVVALARKGEAPLKQIARDFGISEGALSDWLKKADIEDGHRAGLTDAERVELRKTKKRIRLLEQENEVLRRAAAYLPDLPRDVRAVGTPLSPCRRAVERGRDHD